MQKTEDKLHSRTTRVTEWVSGGKYAVKVEVDAQVLPERPDEFYYAPDTVRFLEKLARHAEMGELDELRKVGVTYVRETEG